MSRSGRVEDRGLRAVARVREVRERDSRIGLLHALRSVGDREAEVARLHQALDGADSCEAATMGAYVANRDLLVGAARAVREAEERLRSSRAVAAEARSRWQSDEARLRTIEHLLEQRRMHRSELLAHLEAKEADDVGTRLHSRTHSQEHQG